MTHDTTRVLIVGRSARALRETVSMLRGLGYAANATNQFDRVLDDYDPRDVDLVVFGGRVSPPQREHLEAEMTRLHPQVRFLSGLGGVAPLLTAQVEELLGGAAPGVEHDTGTRAVRVTVPDATRVVVTALWAVPVPPDPVPHSLVVVDDELPAGSHTVPLPEDVPERGAYVGVRVGDRVTVLRIGPAPRPAARGSLDAPLPDPEPVTTHLPWEVRPAPLSS